ncbi:MAG: TRAP transporter small permease subunit [Dehalococcoidia bacterium]|nr:TRAP transporter small permease subunit [Dehalococcoidia bacterium]
MKVMSSLLRSIDTLNRKLGWVFAFMLIPMAGIVIWDILMRYFLNKPSVWAYETSLFIYGGYIVLTGAYTLLHKGHVNVDIIYGSRSARTRAILDVCTASLFFLYMWFLLRYSFAQTITSWQIQETTNTFWHPVYYPLKTTLPVACILLMLQGGAKFIRDLYMAVTGKELPNE